MVSRSVIIYKARFAGGGEVCDKHVGGTLEIGACGRLRYKDTKVSKAASRA